MFNGKYFFNNPLYVLMTILSAISLVLLLIRFSGFIITFMLLVDIFVCIALSAIILILTIFSIKTKCESTKISSVAYGFLPVLSIAFVLLILINSGMNTYAYLALFLIMVLVCSMILFFTGIKHLLAKIFLGIAYFLVIIPTVFVLFLTTLPPFGHNEVIQSTISPNGHYKAELWESSQGALGGATWIYVTRQPNSINFFFAELQRRPMRVYSGRWGEFHSMTLYWEADNILHVDFDTPLTFRFNGQRWIRE